MTRPMKRHAGAAAAAAVALTLVACGGGGTSGDGDLAESGETSAAATETAAVPAGGFEYEDARGQTVSLEAVPTTVVAQSSVAAALWDAGYRVAGVYGELTPVDGELSYQAGDIDLDEVAVLGHTWGEFDVEDYGLMGPDLLIDYTFDGTSLWYVPAEQAEQIFALAPSLGVPGNYTDTTGAIETFVDLAVRLGADPDSQELADDKAAYEAALDAVADVAAASGLKVVVVSADTDSLYVANPEYLPELATLRGAGLDLIDPKGGDPNVFHQFSWEQASDYAEADVILFDARTYDAVATDLAGIPTWASLPAVQAGQVYPWYAAAPYSYKAYAGIYQEVADELAAARKLG